MRILKSNNGMGIVQILAASALIMTIIYGIISMLTYSARQQQKQTMLVNLQELKNKMQNLLSDPDAWQKTLHAPANAISFNCLLTNSICTLGAHSISEIIDAADVQYGSNLPNDWNLPTNFPSGGFTERGIPCTGFDIAAAGGSDSCPFSYKIIWEPLLAGKKPGFRITARLLYNPAQGAAKRAVIQLGSSTGLLPLDNRNIYKFPVTPSAWSAASPNQISDSETGKFDVVVWRTATTNIPGFRVVSLTSGPCKTALNPASARDHWVSVPASGGYDPFNLTIISNGAGNVNNRINLKVPGTYACDVTSDGYDVGGFSAHLMKTTGANIDYGGSSSIALNGIQSTVQFNTSFKTPGNEDFELWQACDANGGFTGLGLVGAAGTVLGSITCVMVNGD